MSRHIFAFALLALMISVATPSLAEQASPTDSDGGTAQPAQPTETPPSTEEEVPPEGVPPSEE